MNSAATKTYLSKRMMQQYAEQRQARSEVQAKPSIPEKKFAEDEEEKKEDDVPNIAQE